MRFYMKYKTLYEKNCLIMSYGSYTTDNFESKGKLEQGRTNHVFNMS